MIGWKCNYQNDMLRYPNLKLKPIRYSITQFPKDLYGLILNSTTVLSSVGSICLNRVISNNNSKPLQQQLYEIQIKVT